MESTMYRNILVAVDGSDTSRLALDHAIALAKSESARLLAIFVVEYPSSVYSSAFFDIEPFYAAMMEEARTVLDGAKRQIEAGGAVGDTKVVDAGALGGSIAEQIQAAAADTHSDLVVLGTHGRRGFQRLMLGSVAEAYVRLSTCPVLLVHGKEAKAD
jgi:nucleotide-binding universal stress UspA family protein